MYARITVIEMPPERLSDFEALSRRPIGPSFVGVPGQRLGFYLIDRTRGRVMMVPVWESEEALDRTEAALDELIEQARLQCGAQLVSIERYEVFLPHGDRRGIFAPSEP